MAMAEPCSGDDTAVQDKVAKSDGETNKRGYPEYMKTLFRIPGRLLVLLSATKAFRCKKDTSLHCNAARSRWKCGCNHVGT